MRKGLGTKAQTYSLACLQQKWNQGARDSWNRGSSPEEWEGCAKGSAPEERKRGKETESSRVYYSGLKFLSRSVVKQLLEWRAVPSHDFTFPLPAERWDDLSLYNFVFYHATTVVGIFFSVLFLDTLCWVPSSWWHYLVLSQVFHPSQTLSLLHVSHAPTVTDYWCPWP